MPSDGAHQPPCALCTGRGTLKAWVPESAGYEDRDCPRCKGTKIDPPGARPVIRCSPHRYR